MEKRLTRIPSDAVLGGVASGMANYFGIDTTIIRVLWAVALLLPIPPSFFWTTIAYIILWAVLPESGPETTINTPSSASDDSTREPIGSSFFSKSSDPDRTVKIIGIALLGVGAILLLNELPYWYQIRQYIWPAALIIAGAYLLLRQRDKEQYESTSPYTPPPAPPTPPVEPDPVPYRPFDSAQTEPTDDPSGASDSSGPADPDGETDPNGTPPQVR